MISETAPVLYRAAHVIAQSSGPEPEAFAVADGRIRATGDLASLRDRFPGAREVDLGASTVIPGLHDAHIHLANAAEDLLHLDLSAAAVRDVDDLLARVAASAESGAWVRGSRYDDVKTGPLTRWDLDRVAPDNPVIVVQVAGHWGVANSRALRELGISESSSPPPGGEYGRSPDGLLDGRLIERALMNVVYPATARGSSPLPVRACRRPRRQSCSRPYGPCTRTATASASTRTATRPSAWSSTRSRPPSARRPGRACAIASSTARSSTRRSWQG
jgi:predicted amidohydrolase YtcJ